MGIPLELAGAAVCILMALIERQRRWRVLFILAGVAFLAAGVARTLEEGAAESPGSIHHST